MLNLLSPSLTDIAIPYGYCHAVKQEMFAGFICYVFAILNKVEFQMGKKVWFWKIVRQKIKEQKYPVVQNKFIDHNMTSLTSVKIAL